MPLYEYRCQKCGKTYEALARNALAPTDPCPACGSKRVEKLFSSFSTNSSSTTSTALPPCAGGSCGLPAQGCCGGGCGFGDN